MLAFSAPGLPTLDLDDIDEGYVCEEWVIAAPAIREVIEPRTLANGILDWTQFTGARAVTFQVVVFPNPRLGLTTQGQIDRLARYCRPDLRPTLTWSWQHDDLRMMVLRANPGLDAPFPNNAFGSVRVGMSFVAPDSLVWASDDNTIGIYPTGIEEGRTYYEAEVITPGGLYNLLGSDNQASIETGTTTPGTGLGASSYAIWGANQLVARDPAVARVGTSSLAMTHTGAAAAQATPTQTGAGPQYFPVIAGNVYTLLHSAMVDPPNTDLRWQSQIQFRDAGGVALSGPFQVAPLAAAGVWEDRVYSALAPAGAATAYLLFNAYPAANGPGAHLDRVALYDSGPYLWVPGGQEGGDNLLTYQQSDIEAGPTTPASGIPGWAVSGSGSTVARSTAWAASGISSLAMSRISTVGSANASWANDAGVESYFPVVPGERYVMSAVFYTLGAAGLARLLIRCRNASGAIITGYTDQTPNAPLTSGVPRQLYFDVTIPPGAVEATMLLAGGNSIPVGDVIHVDQVMLTKPRAPEFYLPSQGSDPIPTGTFGRDYDRSYPDTTVPHVLVANAGQAVVPWRAVIHGPCTNPRLINDTTGEGLYLTVGNYTLLGGEAVVLDSATKTIRTDDGTNRYPKLDIAKSRWFDLVPGDNLIRFYPDTSSPGTVCEFTWREAWL
jgi:hypothetical protein